MPRSLSLTFLAVTDAGICLLGMIFIYCCFPEVRPPPTSLPCAQQLISASAPAPSLSHTPHPQVSNLSLEEIQQLFLDDFGIRKSRVIRREKAAARRAERAQRGAKKHAAELMA